MSGQNGHRCPYCKDRFETQQRLDEHVPCPSPAGDTVGHKPTTTPREDVQP